MSYRKNLTIRIDDYFAARIGQLLNTVAERPRRDRSRVIRGILSKETALWLESPYIARSSKHFLLITASGDVFLRSVEVLEMREAREFLPAQVTMKREKAEEFLRRFEDSENAAQAIRDLWIVNHFAAWNSDSIVGDPAAAHVDRLGMIKKTADLHVCCLKDTLVTREIIVGNRDYVQWAETEEASNTAQSLSDDRGCVYIDVPTIELEFCLLVDLDLYSHAPRVRDVAALSFELRNREAAVMKRSGRQDNPAIWTQDRHPDARYYDSNYDPALKATQTAFEALRTRLREIGSDAAPQLQRMDLSRGEFLFGQLRWRFPFQGLEVGLTWNKPPKR